MSTINPGLYNQLSDQELLQLILETIDEYMLLTETTSNLRAIEDKRIELFRIYEIIRQRGLEFQPGTSKDDNK